MREIEFRGKTLNDGFAYGLLAKQKEVYYISNSAGAPFAYDVITETIGQYTGLKDRNGIKIFEGDIIIHKTFGIGYVCFLQQELGYVCVLEKGEFKLGHRGSRSGYDIDSNIKVIGNIYDNKDLLKGDK